MNKTFPKKLEEAIRTMNDDKRADFDRLGPMKFDEIWSLIGEKTTGDIASGKETSPVLVLRLEDGNYALVFIDDFPYENRSEILRELILAGGREMSEGQRITGVMFFSEAYATNKIEHVENNDLGEGRVAEGQETLMAAGFDGLTGNSELHMVPINRVEGQAPCLGEWMHYNEGVTGGLKRGLIMGVFVHNLERLGLTVPEIVMLMQSMETN